MHVYVKLQLRIVASVAQHCVAWMLLLSDKRKLRIALA